MEVCQLVGHVRGTCPLLSFPLTWKLLLPAARSHFFPLLARNHLHLLHLFLLPPASPAEPICFLLSSTFRPQQQQQQQQQQKQLQEQRQNRGGQRQLKGDRRSCIFRPFSGHFRRLSLKLEACLTPIFSNSSQLLQIPLKSLNSNSCVLELK